MKAIAILSALGFLLGWTQPVFAQAVHVDPMPWTAQLGVCGGCLTILLLVVVRVIPAMSRQHSASLEKVAEVHRESTKEFAKAHAEALGEVKDELNGLRDDFNGHQESNASLLREVLLGQRGPK